MERLRLEKIQTGKITVVDEVDRDLMPVHPGSKEQKSFVELKLSTPSKTRNISMVSKFPGFISGLQEDQSKADAYYDIWLRLHKLGFPVVNTLRKVSDDEVMMTDYRTKNVGLYGKGSYWSLLIEQYSPTPYDDSFVNLPLSEVHQDATKLAHFASERGVILPTDNAYELTVGAQSWDLLLLDIGRTTFNNSSQSALQKNIGYVNDVTEMLAQTQLTLRYRQSQFANRL